MNSFFPCKPISKPAAAIAWLGCALLVATWAACVDKPYEVCPGMDRVCGPGYVCTPDGRACVAAKSCGNGWVDPDEVCDDGNRLSGDGCSSDCLSREECGNGTRDVSEACDDGNLENGDNCSEQCLFEKCGNGELDGEEICDDGNNINGDGCSADCASDETCGNGYIDWWLGERCDGDDDCPMDCRWGSCGDRALQAGEACDDGNIMDDDGCSATCLREPVGTCDGADCSNAGLLSDMHLTGARVPDLGFVASRTAYSIDVSLLQEEVSVVAIAAYPGMEIEVEGRPVASGEPSAPVALALGENVISVAVRYPAISFAVTYEITVNRAGAIAQAAYAKASNTGADDHFGRDVALSANGDTLAVGADYEDSNAAGVNGNQADDSAADSGAVYVFERSGTSWVQQAYIKASNTGINDKFGASVALSASGDTLAVAAWFEDSNATGVNSGGEANNSALDSGAVYVFERSGSTWVQQAYIKASNTDTNDNFGASVALSGSGDTLAVGARYEDSNATGVNSGGEANNSAPDSGAVYVFERSGSVWAQQAYIKASNTGSGDWFGVSVALSASGDALAVGAPYEDSVATGVGGDQADNTASDSGAVYVFERSGTSWVQQAYIKASNTGINDRFGASVALSASGDTLAVGAELEDSNAMGVNSNQPDNSAADSGAVYVFARSGGTWAQEAYIKASNTGAGDQFGVRVALSGSGDTLAMGAEWEDSNATGVDGNQNDNSAADSGAVYVFARSGGVWAQQAYIKASNTGANDHFGRWDVALSGSGDTLAVGARYEDSNATGIGGNQADDSASQSGAVYIFH